jgi:hypothetical protein
VTHPADEYPVLSQFFGGYFHQDWPEEYPPGAGVSDVVEAYAEGNAEGAREVVAELDRLLAADHTDEELERIVDLLSTSTSFNDPSARAEMTAIRDQLQSYLDTHPDDEVPPEPEPTGA